MDAVAKRAYRGSTPPTQVVMLGCSLPWSESFRTPHAVVVIAHPKGCRCGCERDGLTRPFAGRSECPNDCNSRDLARERRLGLNRVCLRCYCHTGDPEGWQIPVPILLFLAEKRAKAEAARLASFAEKKYAGRKSARRAV